MPIAYLGLGSNLGVRLRQLQEAVEGLAEMETVEVTGASAVYATEAHTLDPDETQPAFLNAVVCVDTTLDPEALLRTAKALEAAAGRDPEARRWAPRALDVDLLLVGDETRTTDRLTLPHPRLAERRFVLRPLADLAPNLVCPPPFDAPVAVLLDRCTDAGGLVRTPYPLYVRPPLGPPRSGSPPAKRPSPPPPSGCDPHSPR